MGNDNVQLTLFLLHSTPNKSIYPLDGRIHETGERTSVHAMRENSVKLNLGVDPVSRISSLVKRIFFGFACDDRNTVTRYKT
jgi:hypothetical protein